MNSTKRSFLLSILDCIYDAYLQSWVLRRHPNDHRQTLNRRRVLHPLLCWHRTEVDHAMVAMPLIDEKQYNNLINQAVETFPFEINETQVQPIKV